MSAENKNDADVSVEDQDKFTAAIDNTTMLDRQLYAVAVKYDQFVDYITPHLEQIAARTVQLSLSKNTLDIPTAYVYPEFFKGNLVTEANQAKESGSTIVKKKGGPTVMKVNKNVIKEVEPLLLSSDCTIIGNRVADIYDLIYKSVYRNAARKPSESFDKFATSITDDKFKCYDHIFVNRDGASDEPCVPSNWQDLKAIPTATKSNDLAIADDELLILLGSETYFANSLMKQRPIVLDRIDGFTHDKLVDKLEIVNWYQGEVLDNSFGSSPVTPGHRIIPHSTEILNNRVDKLLSTFFFIDSFENHAEKIALLESFVTKKEVLVSQMIALALAAMKITDQMASVTEPFGHKGARTPIDYRFSDHLDPIPTHAMIVNMFLNFKSVVLCAAPEQIKSGDDKQSSNSVALNCDHNTHLNNLTALFKALVDSHMLIVNQLNLIHMFAEETQSSKTKRTCTQGCEERWCPKTLLNTLIIPSTLETRDLSVRSREKYGGDNQNIVVLQNSRYNTASSFVGQTNNRQSNRSQKVANKAEPDDQNDKYEIHQKFTKAMDECIPMFPKLKLESLAHDSTTPDIAAMMRTWLSNVASIVDAKTDLPPRTDNCDKALITLKCGLELRNRYLGYGLFMPIYRSHMYQLAAVNLLVHLDESFGDYVLGGCRNSNIGAFGDTRNSINLYRMKIPQAVKENGVKMSKFTDDGSLDEQTVHHAPISCGKVKVRCVCERYAKGCDVSEAKSFAGGVKAGFGTASSETDLTKDAYQTLMRIISNVMVTACTETWYAEHPKPADDLTQSFNALCADDPELLDLLNQNDDASMYTSFSMDDKVAFIDDLRSSQPEVYEAFKHMTSGTTQHIRNMEGLFQMLCMNMLRLKAGYVPVDYVNGNITPFTNFTPAYIKSKDDVKKDDGTTRHRLYCDIPVYATGTGTIYRSGSAMWIASIKPHRPEVRSDNARISYQSICSMAGLKNDICAQDIINLGMKNKGLIAMVTKDNNAREERLTIGSLRVELTDLIGVVAKYGFLKHNIHQIIELMINGHNFGDQDHVKIDSMRIVEVVKCIDDGVNIGPVCKIFLTKCFKFISLDMDTTTFNAELAKIDTSLAATVERMKSIESKAAQETAAKLKLHNENIMANAAQEFMLTSKDAPKVIKKSGGKRKPVTDGKNSTKRVKPDQESGDGTDGDDTEIVDDDDDGVY